jgi:TonB-dependent receptor
MSSFRSASWRRFILTPTAMILAASIGFAATPETSPESRDGIVKGRINDPNGRPLVGASIAIKPGHAVATTDRDGFFAIRELPAGTYTIEFSYLGMETSKQEIKVEAEQTLTLKVKLQEAIGSTEVTVTGSRVSGEVEALNQEKDAMDIVNVLPAEVITSLPNANVADAIGRLASVSLERDEGEGKYVQIRGLESRYTSVSINGVRIPSSEAGVRQIKLDAFPSDLLGTIELHKTVSADLEGDAIGGSVNMITKSAPDEGMATFGVETGYNDQAGGRYSSLFEGTFANRYGADKALGVVFGATYDRNGRSINDIEPTPSVVTLPGGSQADAFTAMDMRDYRYDRKRYGVAGALDYRLDDSSFLYLKTFYSKFKNFGDRWVTSISAGNFLTPTTTDNTGGYSGNVQNRRPIEETYSVVAGGRQDLKSVLIDYSLAYSHASQDRVGQMQGDYNGPSAAFTVDSSNGDFPQFTPQGGVNYLDPTQWTLSRFRTSDERTAARSTALEFNAVFPYEGGFLKTGLRYRDEDKTSAYNDASYDLTGPATFTLDQGLDSYSDPGYYMGHYKMGPMASLYAIENFFKNNQSSFTQNASNDRINNDPNNWDAKERVSAAYVKNTNQIANAQLEYGVRIEHTSTQFAANLITLDASGNWKSTSPLDGSSSYTNVLPSISWRYEIDKDTILRAVYGWGIARPNYGQLVPSLTASDVTVHQVFAGNPDLKPTKAANYDVLFERYTPSIGVFSAGVFYKDLKDPIYGGASTTLVGGPYNGYQEIKPINGPKANLYGFELAWKQHLSFLPGAWSGLGIDTNYTHTHSKATFDLSTGRSGSAALQRTAPDLANLGLTYDWSGFSMRLAATYNSAMIFTYNYQDGADGGLGGPNGDTYLYAHTQIDAQASYAFKNGLKVTLSALNLNNEVFGFYNGSSQWAIQREFYSRTFTLGIRKAW